VEAIRILLVEDDRDNAYLLSRLLGHDRYRVWVARTLAEAKQLCDAQAFDVMICDLGLPDGEGIEALAYARRTSNVAGIVLSGYGDDEHRDGARAAGFAEFLVKPTPLTMIEDAIQRAMNR